MHIPDMMIQGIVCPVTGALAAVGVAGAAYAACKTRIKPVASLFAGVTALIFAAQMANFPIHLGTSGHLLGATLAVALLGSAFGIMAMSLVVIAQCLVFADGGISVLGANLLNIALISSLPAVFVLERFSAMPYKKTAYFVAAFVATVLAAGVCAVQLAISGAAPLSSVLPAMLSIHVLLGLAEAGLTVTLLAVMTHHAASKITSQRAWIIPLGIATIIAVLVSPFASALPDGLESVACALSLGSGTLFAAPFAEYAIPNVASEVLSTALAGFVGIVLLFVVAYGTGRALVRSGERSA